jgi:hypothetical protein
MEPVVRVSSLRAKSHSLLHGRRELGSLLNRPQLVADMPRHSPVQHLGDMLHLTSGLSNLRPMTTCSVEGAHAERLREIFACWARQHQLSPALRVQEGALHDLADHDNIAAVRGDAQAQVPTAFLISSTTRTTTGTPAAEPAMIPGC